MSLTSLLILALPLLSFIVLSLFGKRLTPCISGIIGIVSLFASMGLSLYTAFVYFSTGNAGGAYLPDTVVSFKWLQFTQNLSITLGIVLDPISVMMLVVITVVSSMVHLYSFKYMQGEERFSTYYAYLSLFTFAMLGLVISVNLFQMYIFWELVGVSSFLLIGFFFTKPSAIAAAKKAFIVTRFADLGFLIGILILGFGAQTLDFNILIQRLTTVGSPYLASLTSTTFIGGSLLTWGLMLVFTGGAGKSAMFPLHIWLPDAMEGPTPVSALIHAATMVVAGVYLVARLFPVFAISAPEALTAIAYIGAFTAFFAAVIACTQTDIKRVLAYSTISQIAFMMFALGVASWGKENSEGFTASMFHLFTHAFFKASLFLGAGSIIHAVHSNEMKDMGGLRKSMPVTHITFLLACLAIAGIPPFAGFFSKEAILNAAHHGNPFVFYIALATSGLTAFYMFRLYFNIFWNKSKESHAHDDNGHKHENWVMNLPLIILAFGSVFSGLIPFGKFVSADGQPIELPFHLTFSIAPVLVGVLGILIARYMYIRPSENPDKVAAAFGRAYKWAYHKFYIDEIYLFVTKKILFNLVGRPAAWFDRNVVDGMINGYAAITTASSEAVKFIQSGRLQTYTMFFLGGVLVIAVLLLMMF